MISPFAQLNKARQRAEAIAWRLALRHVLAALCLAVAGLMLAHMALSTALAIPDLAAKAIATRGM